MHPPKGYNLTHIIKLSFAASPMGTLCTLLLALLQGLAPLLLAIATAAFIDSALAIAGGHAAFEAVYLPIAGVVSLVALGWFADQLGRLSHSHVQLRLRETYRAELTQKCARLEYAHIENPKTWDLISRVSTKSDEQIAGGFAVIRQALQLVLNVAGVIGLLLAQVWWAAFLIVAFSVPLMRLAIKSGKANYQAQRDTEREERKQKYLIDTLLSREASEERALFGFSGELTQKFMQEFKKAYRVRFRTNAVWFTKMKLGAMIFGCISVLIAFVLLQPTIAGTLSIGMFMSLVNATFSLVQEMSWSLTYIMDEFAKKREYLRDLAEFHALSETVDALARPAEPPLAFGSLEFRGVRFTYPGTERAILNGLSLRIDAGEHIALVGVNGAGKTTLTKLITGLYDNYEGEILLNGRDIRTYREDERKSLCALVFQDFARYQVSMKDNITLAYESRETKLNDAMTALSLDEAARVLKGGVDTPLGKLEEDGQDLSGGQWQRVAIARALVSPAPLRILDEPTAALDPISESNIYRQFKALSGGTATLFISHRLGSTKLADRIYVIGDGRVLETGTHDELTARRGLYAEMYDAQRSWYQ